MGSTRLPGKMMMDIAGKPIVERVIERARMSRLANDVWLATTTSHADDVLADWAVEKGIPHYRGSEVDVLDRYYHAAIQSKADVIVRVTGDCPVLDPQVTDRVIQAFLDGEYDYVSNTQPPTFPDGLDTEVVSFAALEKAWKEAKLNSEREHVMPYIWKHPDKFKLFNIANTEDFSNHRWTLDTPEDFEFLRLLIESCEARGGFYGLNEVLSICLAHPEWQGINAHHTRNEGYTKSLGEDPKNVVSE